MLRFFVLLAVPALLVSGTFAADQTVAEKAIAKAIELLEVERDAAAGALDQARIGKAIRELEALLGDAEPKPTKIDFEVKPAVLKKKFGGKAAFNPKTSELTLTYDFSKKPQFADFESNPKIQIVPQGVVIEAAESLKHNAEFRSFTASAVMVVKSMRGCGISSTNGSRMRTGDTGGAVPNGLYIDVPGGASEWKVVPADAVAGKIPVSLAVSSSKTTVKYANESLAAATVHKDDVHQIVIEGGSDGCGLTNLVIVGIPDPAWFKNLLASE